MKVVSAFRLDPIVCGKKQRVNKDKCRCECLVNKNATMILLGVLVTSNEYKNAAELTTEECEEIIDDIRQNKKISITKYVENWKSFVASSILFMSVLIILSKNMIYFCAKSRNNDVLLY